MFVRLRAKLGPVVTASAQRSHAFLLEAAPVGQKAGGPSLEAVPVAAEHYARTAARILRVL